MPKIAIPGGEIHYEECGSGEALLLSSGLNGLARNWQAQLPAFSAHFRCISYDQRGTGASDRNQKSYSVDGMAEDARALLDALNIERAHFVGHSTGGAIGQTLAIVHPRRVGRLVICNSWTHRDPFFRRLFEARREMYLKGGSDLHVLFHPLWLYSHDYINSHDAEIDEEQRRARGNAPPLEVSLGRIDALLGFDRRADLGRIASPTLVIGCDNDYITPSYFSEALARAIPGASLHIARGAGHSFSKTRPDEYNRLVLDFLLGRS